jgi:hypothetical protein
MKPLDPILYNFWGVATLLFSKLDHFTIVHYFPIALKWPSLQERVSNFNLKILMERL